MADSGPADWTRKRLTDLATVKARLGWKGLKADEYLSDGVVLLATPNLKSYEIDFFNVNYISEWRYQESPEIQLAEGDVLLVKDGSTLGVTNIVRRLRAPTTVNGSIAVLRPNEQLVPAFLYQYVSGRDFQKLVQDKKGGLGVPHLFQADLREFILRVPPVPEQRQIAEILDTLDEAIRKTEEIIAKLKQVKQGLLHDLLTRGIDDNGELRDPDRHPEQFKDSPLGRIPKQWEVVKLGGSAEIRYGVNDAIDQSLTRGVPTVTLPCVSPDGELTLRNELLAWTAPYKVGSALLLEEGDLLFNWRNGSRHHLGKTGYFGGGIAMTHVGFLLRIRANRDLMHPMFLWQSLRYLKEVGVFLRAKSQVNNTFNSAELRELRVIQPSLPEQARIADSLHSLETRLAEELAQIEKLGAVKQGLMEDLLTGRVRVTKLLESAAE